MDNQVENGLKIIGELLGQPQADAMKQQMESDTFAAAASELALRFAFSEVWGRPGLERKQRSLITIGVLVASRQPAELRNHIKIGINNGLTAQEIQEALIQTIPYTGFPAFSSALTIAIETLRDLGLDSKSLSPEERGLL